MFNLEKEMNVIDARDVKPGHAFEHQGEIFIRITVPTEPPLKIGEDAILAISIETWHLQVVNGEADVEAYKVDAVARPVLI